LQAKEGLSIEAIREAMARIAEKTQAQIEQAAQWTDNPKQVEDLGNIGERLTQGLEELQELNKAAAAGLNGPSQGSGRG
jgi:hypothetical protein